MTDNESAAYLATKLKEAGLWDKLDTVGFVGESGEWVCVKAPDDKPPARKGTA